MEFLKVKNFATVTTGGTPSTKNKDFWENGDIPWLNSGELNQNIVKTTRNYITENGLKNSAAKLMPENTVLIALTGATTGVVGYLTFEASANQSVTGILPSDKHIPKYLFYYLKSIRPKVLHDAYGGAQPHISQGYVKDLEIPLPPLDQQKKIAAILDAADAYRQKTKALIEKYDELTQSLFLDMFGDPVTNPKGFEKSKIVDECDVKGGKRVPKGEKLIKEVTNHPYIKAQNIKNGFINVNKLEYLTEELAVKLKRYIVNEGNVCITVVGVNIGDIGIVPKSLHLANLTENANKLLIKDDSRLDNIYLAYYMMSDFVQRQVRKRTMAVGVPKLALFRIEQIELLVPPISLQQKFKDQLASLEIQKAQTQASLAQAEDLFNSLLQRAFKGELTS